MLFDEAFLKKIELLHLVSKKVFAGNLQATRRARKLGAGIEVRDFRPYVSGDDLRHIDWNYYASTRELLVRLFEEEEDLHIYFLIDVSDSMHIGHGEKLIYAKKVAAALGYIGLANLDRVSMVPFSSQLHRPLPSSRGRSQIWKIFRYLEKDFDAGKTNTADAFRRFVTQTRRRGMAVVISDFYDHAGFIDALNFLRFHRFEPLVFQIFDENDLNPSLKGDLELVDCETGEKVRITVTNSMLKRYREAHRELMDEVHSFCKQKNVLYFRAPVQVEFDELVLRVFRAGGFLR